MAQRTEILSERTRAQLAKLIGEVGASRAALRLQLNDATLARAAAGYKMSAAVRYQIEHKLKESEAA